MESLGIYNETLEAWSWQVSYVTGTFLFLSLTLILFLLLFYQEMISFPPLPVLCCEFLLMIPPKNGTQNPWTKTLSQMNISFSYLVSQQCLITATESRMTQKTSRKKWDHCCGSTWPCGSEAFNWFAGRIQKIWKHKSTKSLECCTYSWRGDSGADWE